MDEQEAKDEIKRIEMSRRIHEEARKFGLRGLAQNMFLIIMTVIGLLIVFIDPKIAQDYFRIFCLSMGSYIIIFSLRIIQINRRIIKYTEGAMRGLPLHIQAIATSYIIYCVSLHSWVISRIGTPDVFWYGVPLIIMGDLIGIFALGVIWRFQEVRRKAAGL